MQSNKFYNKNAHVKKSFINILISFIDETEESTDEEKFNKKNKEFSS
jgi:hypothetical protein